MGDITFATWAEFVIYRALMLPLLALPVMVVLLRRRLLVTSTTMQSSMSLHCILRCATWPTVMAMVVLTSYFTAIAGSEPLLAVIGLIVISCLVIVPLMLAPALRVVVSLSQHGYWYLPSDLRYDHHVVNALRSWSAPQWMPRWACFTLPDC